MEPDRINDRITLGLGGAEKHKCIAGDYHEGLRIRVSSLRHFAHKSGNPGFYRM